MKQLSREYYSLVKRPIRVMQFGEGNFLRAFVDWIIQTLNDTSDFNSNVLVVQPIEFGRIKELKEQDGLYTLLLEGITDKEEMKSKQVINSLEEFINPYLEYDKYLEFSQSEDLRFIISNTTEAGIVLDKSDTDFSKTPKTFPGKLLSFLRKRYDYFNGSSEAGLEIIPCELIDYNGEELKRVLLELSKIKNYDEEFIDWLMNSNRYYNTLVDRIVPGYPRTRVEELQNELGYIDNSMVMAEVFHLWVIEDHHNLKRYFPVEQAGLNVLFVDDFLPYKERKVKILNGSHTLLMPVGYLAGIDTVRETVNDEVIGKFVHNYIFDEVIPTINLPKEEMKAFATSVLERYQNPFIRHELMSISLNSYTKYKTRILPTVIFNIEKLNKLPINALFSFAAMLVFYRGKRGNEDIALNDDAWVLEMFKELWAKTENNEQSVRELVTKVLAMKDHWGVDLNTYSGVCDYVSEQTYRILNNDIKKLI